MTWSTDRRKILNNYVTCRLRQQCEFSVTDSVVSLMEFVLFSDWYLESVNEYMGTPQESIESNETTSTVLRARTSGSNRIRQDNSGKGT